MINRKEILHIKNKFEKKKIFFQILNKLNF